MAKTKRRAGAAPGAPKPKIVPPKTPITRRRWFKLVPIAVLVLLAAILTPILLGKAARADDLRAYDRALQRALLPFNQHQATTVPDSFASIPDQFRQGTVTPKALEESAARWAEDFTEAGDNVRALGPPDELVGANAFISQTMDLYAGIARQYVVLADEQRLAEAATGETKRDLEQRVSAWLDQIGAQRSRADAQLALGQRLVDELKVAWGVTPAPAAPDLSDIEIPPDILPDGGAHE